MNPQTAIEKELSRISGEVAEEGDYVWGKPDLVYMHDLLGPSCMEAMEDISHGKTRFGGEVVLVNDHIYPPQDIQSANNAKNMVNQFMSRRWTITPPGSGIENKLLFEIVLRGNNLLFCYDPYFFF